MPLLSVFLTVLGVISVLLFEWGYYFPIWASIIVLVGVSLFMMRAFAGHRAGMLMMVMWLIYALPFIHIVPYLWFDFGLEAPPVMWGLAVNPYMLDEEIVRLTAMIGAVGGIGFALGVTLALSSWRLAHRCAHDLSMERRAMSFPAWLAWVGVGVGLSYLAAPQDTILTAQYTQSKSLLEGLNFSSAWMVSYGLLIFAFCDGVLDADPIRRGRKLKWVISAVAFVVIFLQIMRGDRESIPMVFALFIAYFYWTRVDQVETISVRTWAKLGLMGFLLLAVAMVVGILRSVLAGLDDRQAISTIADLYESGPIRISNMFYGTWSAVLLTPLSVAGDHIHSELRLGLGDDYLKFLLSVPPGFVADAVGYVRPIDGLSGPAWEMRYGIGGTHATVVPFLNFRMVGVLLVTAVWAYVLQASEQLAMRRLSVPSLAFLAIMVTAAPHWLWYGEKNGLNSVMIWLVLWGAYRISLLTAIQN